MPDFRIQAREVAEKIFLIEAEGHLDADTFEMLEKEIEDHFGRGIFRFIVNLEKVDYISSAGASVLIGARHHAQDNGGSIIFLNPHVNVKDVFDLLGLSQIFSFASGVEEAIAQF